MTDYFWRESSMVSGIVVIQEPLPTKGRTTMRFFETPRSTRPIVSDEWLFRLVTYVPGSFAIMLDEHFVALKQSRQRGVAVDNWTLCVRGEVAASGG